MKAYNFLKEEVRNLCCIITLVASNELCYLGEPIDYYHNSILPSRSPWDGHDEVHVNIILMP